MKPKIPSSWNECSWEQLVEIYRLMGEYSDQRSVRNLHIWLFLTKLVFAEGEGEIADDGEVTYYLKKAPLSSPQGGKNPIRNILSPLGEPEGAEEFFAVKADDLSLYLNGSHLTEEERKVAGKNASRLERMGALDWVDEMVGKGGQGGLTQLPIDTITIGKKQWRLPSALITSITYEQYTNAQQLQQAVWSLTDNLKQEQQRIMEELQAGQSGTLNASPESPEERSDQVSPDDIQQRLAELEPMAQELQRYRAQLLSHLLIQAEKGAEYKSEDAEERVDFFVKHIDEHPYLLDILIQHLQSCLGVYKTQFPDLFSGDGKGSDTIPMVSEVNTINAIMKWQGYQEQQKVFDSNAIFIFSILNSMTKEAKAIEEANAKMKRHRK